MDGLAQLTLLLAAVLVVIGLLAIRRRVLARMALRNIVRRKRFAAIVVVGLLIATAMISAALVVGDTIDYLIKEDVYTGTGHVDIVITVEDETGLHQFFDEGVARDLMALSGAGHLEHVDGVAPAIRDAAAVTDASGGTAVPSARLFAFDPENTVDDLVDLQGDPISSDLVTAGKAVVNERLARALGVGPGDVVLAFPKNGMPAPLEVSAVAANEGMGAWQGARLLFVDLGYAQEVIFARPSMVTSIDVSCRGSAEKGYLVTDEAIEELASVITGDYEYTYNAVKMDGVEQAEAISDMLSQLFVLMGSFTIIAGIALIVNIFVMLAEERKPEMGISRAVGMQRGDLTQTFVFEGVVYAMVASVIGTFAGLLIALVMINAFSVVIGGAGMSFTLHFEWASLALAAVAGFLITMVTVVVSSWRVSRLNIVRAIRDIPEPILAKSERKYIVVGALAILLGVLLTYGGASSGQAAGTSAGTSLVAIGGAMVAVRFVKPRIPFTLAGLWMVVYNLDLFGVERMMFGTLEGDLEMFVISGVVLVTGGVLVAMFNSDLMLEGLVRVFGRGRSLLPVFRAAISYPMNKRFRTGLTLFIFALIMFTVIVIAMMASFQRESVSIVSEKFSGGFEIVGYSLREVPPDDLTAAVDRVRDSLGVDAINKVETAVTATVSLSSEGSDGPVTRTIVGFSDDMLSEGSFSLAQRSELYASDRDAWNAIMEDPSLTILDGSVSPQMFAMGTVSWTVAVGDVVTVWFGDGASADLTVIGIMDQTLVSGAFSTKAFVQANALASIENLFYIDTVPGSGVTDEAVKDELERALGEYGLSAIVIRDVIEEFMKIAASTMQLMELFLGIGLVVGITGLGIITIRNIAERRQEIGVMRAIGFQRNMILSTFLIETSFVSLLGITIGVVLGLVLSVNLFEWGGFNEYSQFVVPWGEVLLVLLVAFAVTIVSTLPPSRRAARLAPAEALRRVD